RCVVLAFLIAARVDAQQISIAKIEQMPNLPTPYQMRDWRQVALGFDSLVFDLGRSGQYLPAAWVSSNSVNYPHDWLGIHSYVGTNSPSSAEAITVLPAVASATLAGVDKSYQNGTNWVLFCEEYFNKRPEENVYLNHPVTESGSDWWYDTMPNIFFYQLVAHYPSTGDFENQFTTVSRRWFQAVRAMGGSGTPWRVPSMNYRGWELATMTPNSSGVVEPEAAGAIAWILYHAYVRTGNDSCRVGAEWAMEFLNSRSSNPSYELQLPYGVLAAARMNAELGTAYNIEKLVNWCFDIGPLRSWGAVTGAWGGYDCSGLIGEISDLGDYAFAMNTFEQIGALVPLVRYDDRFARAIGKWVLNAANASRLFYGAYLPSANQDHEAWVQANDPASVVAYEGLREVNYGASLLATGDAVNGGWANTNLALYASAHVGILGGIIDTTNVQGILRLDLLATDYFHEPAYPTWLYYNPYDSSRVVEVDVGDGTYDLYDMVSNSFIQTGVSGVVSLSIPADAAVVLVFTPSGAPVTHDLTKILVDGVVVDYQSGQVPNNIPPRIKGFFMPSPLALPGSTVSAYCTAVDNDGDVLAYTWSVSAGSFGNMGATVVWTMPADTGVFEIQCLVGDGNGGLDSARLSIHVVDVLPSSPVIEGLVAQPRKIDLGASTQLICTASDTSGTPLSYAWSVESGVLGAGDTSVTWTAPAVEGNFYVRCVVTNGIGGSAEDSVGIVVRDFSQSQTGDLVASYPFTGSADDVSGFLHHGVISGAEPAADRFEAPDRAYSFNGFTSSIRVPNSDELNFQNAITVAFWMKIGAFYEREQYPLSHGNWKNRWKISMTGDRVRWTVKTTSGIKDLDSETRFETEAFHHIAARYDGSDFEIYVDGELDAFSNWSGTILPTTIDLMIGQSLPTDNQYNFNGVLDEIRLYNYGLSVSEIQALYQEPATGMPRTRDEVADQFGLQQNYPNPFNSLTTIPFSVSRDADGPLSLAVFDMAGREIMSINLGRKGAGSHVVRLNMAAVPSGVYYYVLRESERILAKPMLLIR
ncbi:MAG TPA: LamG-like jellyroll fold domain-containing protein, partial [Bacteroidota bacterium]